MIVPILALGREPGGQEAGAAKPWLASLSPVRHSFVLLIGTVVIVGALTFVPALSIGPVVEHFIMRGTQPLY